jgi:hypothetical protein
LRDLPTLVFGRVQTFFAVKRINRQSLARLMASDQVVEIAVGVGGPDLFNDHGGEVKKTLTAC